MFAVLPIHWVRDGMHKKGFGAPCGTAEPRKPLETPVPGRLLPTACSRTGADCIMTICMLNQLFPAPAVPQTMQIHHDKHHAVYVKGVNDAVSKHPELKDLDLVSLVRAAGTDKIPSDIATPVRNHGKENTAPSPL